MGWCHGADGICDALEGYVECGCWIGVTDGHFRGKYELDNLEVILQIKSDLICYLSANKIPEILESRENSAEIS